VADEQDGLLDPCLQGEQFVLQLAADQRIQRGKRLVHQQNICIRGERSRQADALLHAAGQFADVALGPLRQADELQFFVDDRLSPRGGFTAQFQAEAAYWENRFGTVHDFRVFLFDNDTRILFTIVFDGDFKPYVEDLIKEVTPWLDQIFGGVWEGYKGMKDAGILELVHNAKVDAEFFYAAFPDSTRRDVEKAVRISSAVNELLDAAS